MTKGSAPARLAKTPTLMASMSWPAATDYDLYALVVTRDGRVHHVARFGAVGIPPQPKFRGVSQNGDARRSRGRTATMATETLTIRFDDAVAAVIPVAYSAQSNGTGSFRRYGVSLAVDNGAGQQVRIDAVNASSHDRVYTCVPAVIHNGVDGGVWVEYVEAYSRPKSERRPNALLLPTGGIQVQMDAGPRNEFK